MNIVKVRSIFKKWLAANRDALIHQPYIWRTDDDSFSLRFKGLIDEISIRIASDSIRILLDIYDPEGNYQDTITDLYQHFLYADEKGRKKPAMRFIDMPEQELWEKYLFDYIAAWVNRELVVGRYLQILSFKDGSSFVSYISDVKGIKAFRKRLTSSFNETVWLDDLCFIMPVVENNIPHSALLLKLRKEKDMEKRLKKIGSITDVEPLTRFSIDLKGNVSSTENFQCNNEAKTAFLSGKPVLNGRAAFIGDVIYIIIGGSKIGCLSDKKLALLKKAKWNILNEIQRKNSRLDMAALANIKFINDYGDDIRI